MSRSRWWALAAVFTLAVATRLWVLLSGGGPLDAASYDQSVYFAAAAALVHGHVPYHGDFVFVHPPVVALAGTPFAVLARLTDDVTGFVAENVAFAVMGAVNAVLVVVVARAWGLGRGAVAAGLTYALWPVGYVAESTARLEPLGNLLFLLFLWAYGHGRSGRTRALVLAGVALGLLVNVKLWWFAPVLVVVVLVGFLARELRVVLVPVAVAAGTTLLVDLPFLGVAGPRMVRSIVTAQLHRPDRQWTPGGRYVHLPVVQRLEQLLGASELVVVLLLAALVLTAALACRDRVGRVFVVVLAVQVAILLAAPVVYPYYAGYVAVAGSLVIAAAASRRIPRPAGVAPWGWAAAAGLASVITFRALSPPLSDVDWQALRAQTAHAHCVVADSPLLLIRLHALDRSFGPGCRDVVDLQGVSYGAGPDPEARATLWSGTPAYRRFVGTYLLSGDAVALGDYYVRVRIGHDNRRLLAQRPVIGSSGNVVVRAVTGPPPDR